MASSSDFKVFRTMHHRQNAVQANQNGIDISKYRKSRTSNYNLRGVDVLSLPKVNSTKYDLKCFSYYAAKQRTGDIRTLAETKDFVSKIRSFTF